MFDIGFAELLVVGVLGLIILGPERLPKAARTIGMYVGRIRRTMSGIQREIEQEVRNQEIREKMQDPMRSYLSDDELKARQEEEARQAAEEKAYEQAMHQQEEDADIEAKIKSMHAHHPTSEKTDGENTTTPPNDK